MNRKFRLASVMTLRQRQRDLAAEQVEEINRAIQLYQSQIDEVVKELESLVSQRKHQSTGELEVSELIDMQRYEMQLGLQRQAMQERMQLLLAEKGRRDTALVNAMKNLKAMEHLEQHHIEQLKAHDAKLLQSRLDEWTNTNLIRQQS